jgi:RyR domain-containing protein
MSYQPVPIDNSHIELSADLAKLMELLARNNHDLWARRRMSEGWSRGPQRDDTKKQTPLLIPYDDLPESEKQYDLDNAVETLKTILALGYRIEPPGRGVAE